MPPKIFKTYKAKNLIASPTRQVKFIVLHDTAGSGSDNDTKYLAGDWDNRGIGIDFTVNREGRIEQLNHELRKFYTSHAGRKTRFRSYVGQLVNKNSIGIEIIQFADLKKANPVWPSVQVQAVAELCVYLCKEFNLTKDDITTHARIITDGSRSDPRQWPWNQFWTLFDTFAGITSVRTHLVVKGDTLSSLAVKYSTTIEKLKALNNMDTMSTTIRLGETLTIS